jgi:hypothetical protein
MFYHWFHAGVNKVISDRCIIIYVNVNHHKGPGVFLRRSLSGFPVKGQCRGIYSHHVNIGLEYAGKDCVSAFGLYIDINPNQTALNSP